MKVLADKDSQAHGATQAEGFVMAVPHRQPSKPELRSITPNIFIPLDDTAYSSRTTPIWWKLRASISFSTTAMCGMGLARSDEPWRHQYAHIVLRRNRGIAKVAMARKLAVRLFWMWRQGWDYQPLKKFGSHAG
jgi:hypothetical protein